MFLSYIYSNNSWHVHYPFEAIQASHLPPGLMKWTCMSTWNTSFTFCLLCSLQSKFTIKWKVFYCALQDISVCSSVLPPPLFLSKSKLSNATDNSSSNNTWEQLLSYICHKTFFVKSSVSKQNTSSEFCAPLSFYVPVNIFYYKLTNASTCAGTSSAMNWE